MTEPFRSQHPLIKATSYTVLALLATVLGMWSPPEALVVCTTAFAADGLFTNLLLGKGPVGRGHRWLAFLIPLCSLFLGKSLAVFLGLT